MACGIAGALQNIKRKISTGRNPYQQKRDDADEIIVIEVSGFIDQFDISKTKKKGNDGHPVEITNRDKNRRDDQQRKQCIHPCRTQWFNPIEAVKGKMKLWLDVKIAHPAFKQKTDNTYQHN